MKEELYISIVIPVYNAEKYISKCLDSILEQKYTNYEIIIINDGSTDNTQKVIDKYSSKYNNILSYERENKGPQYTRIEGVKKANGNYIMFIDADDWLEENCLEVFVNELNKGNYDIVRANYNKVSKNGITRIADFKNEDIILKNEINEKIYTKLMVSDCFNSIWRQIVKKDIIDLDSIDSTICMGDDIVFNLACYKNINKMKISNQYVYNYNIIDTSITHNISSDKLERNVNDLFKVYRILTNEMIFNKHEKNITLAYLRYLKKANYNLIRIIANTNDEDMIEKNINRILEHELTCEARKIVKLKDIITKKEFAFLWLLLKNKEKAYVKLLKLSKKILKKK